MKVKGLEGLCSPPLWPSCILSWNVLVHASFSEDCGWIYLVKLQTFHSWGMMRRTWLTNSKNNSLTWTKGDNSHDLYVEKGSLSREYSWSCSHSNSEFVWQIAGRTASAKADNLITPVKTGRIAWGLTFSQFWKHSWNIGPSYLHGAEHSCTQRRMMFSSRMIWRYLSHRLYKKDDDSMWCLWRLTILKNRRNKRCATGITCRWALLCQPDLSWSVIAIWSWFSLIFRHRRKRFEHERQNATKLTSALADPMHSNSWTSHVDFGKDIMFVLHSYDHFSHGVLPSFFSQLCDHVVIKTDWCSQNERMVQRINWQGWRSSFSFFKSREWRCCWDVISDTRACRKWWRRARDEERRLHFLHLHKLVSFFFLELLWCKRA